MALKPLNSVGGFSVGEVPANVILANADITVNNATISGNLYISNVDANWGVLTDNLYYSNGAPWDFQEAAGSNGQIQFNMGNDFDASPNLTFDTATSNFKVTGNANITGTLTAGAIEVDEIFNGNSNVAIPTANGNVNISVSGNANVVVVSGAAVDILGTVDASGNITGANFLSDDGYFSSLGTSGLYLTPGNLTAGIVLQANTTPNSNNALNLGSTSKVFANIYSNNINVTSNVNAGNANLGNLATVNYANITNDINVIENVNTGNIQVNVSANLSNIAVANFVVSNLTPTTDDQYSLGTTTKRWKDINIAGNANIATANISGNITAGNIEFGNLLTGNYATFDNDIQVIGNIANANNISVTNSLAANTGNFSGNITSLNANLGNLATANYVNVAQNVNVSGNLAASYANFVGNVHINPNGSANFGILTDHLYYANGTPWDLQEAAGNNNEIQFNSNDDFAASANFTFNPTTDTLTVTGNANVTNTVNTPNIVGTGGANSNELTLTANGFSTVFDETGNVTFPGDITANTVYANVSGNITTSAANTSVLFSDVGVISGASGFTFDKISNVFSLPGNLQVAGNANITFNANIGQTLNGNVGSFTGNMTVANLTSNGVANVNTLNVVSNVTSDLNPNANLTHDLGQASQRWAEVFAGNVDASGNLLISGNANIVGNLLSGNANLGNLVQANYVNVASNLVSNNVTVNLELAGNTANFSGNVILPNLTVNSELAGNTANFSGNVVVPNLTINLELDGNTANFSGNVVVPNLTVNTELSGNTANFSGNVILPNLTVNTELSGNTANFSGNVILPNLTVNTELSGNTANFIGNVILSGPEVTVNNHFAGNTANFSGNLVAANANLGNLVDANYIRTQELFNGNSNVRIDANGNVTVSLTGLSNVVTFSNAGINVVGYVEANGNGTFGALYSNTLTAQGGNVTIYAAPGDNYVELRPTGNGHVDVANTRIQSVANPINAQDAATKFYVDTVAEGLHVHASCAAATPDTLANVSSGTVTYDNGAAGVGATLTTTGSYTLIDGVNVATVGTRILVKDEANLAHNGIYVYTSSTVLTRATDFDTANEIQGGDFTFVTGGTLYDSTGWVQLDNITTVGTDPIEWDQFSGAGSYTAGPGLTLTGTVFSVNTDGITTEIAGGNVVVKANAQLTTPNIGAATGTSLDLTGNVLAGNLNSNNLITTTNLQASGNILAANISANANLIVNNATINLELSGNTANFSGNVIVPNLTVNTTLSGNVANFSGNITSLNANLGNLATVNYINVANLITTVDANVTGTLTVANANIGGNITVNNLTVNLELAGNTANFSGNVVVPNLSVNLELAGNTANFSGNITSLNANLGNLVVANYVNVASNVTTSNLTVNTELSGNTANFSGNVVVPNLSVNLELAGNTANFSGNVVVPNLSVNLELAGNTANFTNTVVAGNLTTSGIANVAVLNVTGNVTSDLLPNANLTHDLGNSTLRWDNIYAGNIDASGNLDIAGDLSANNFTANILTANTAVEVGNTAINWGEVTTTSITANQTISTISITGVTGVEWIVKGIDSSGAKYSMAMVTAVTDGANVDYSQFGGVNLGSTTGSLAVNIVGSNVELQVTPSSSNSTTWVTQYRTI